MRCGLCARARTDACVAFGGETPQRGAGREGVEPGAPSEEDSSASTRSDGDDGGGDGSAAARDVAGEHHGANRAEPGSEGPSTRGSASRAEQGSDAQCEHSRLTQAEQDSAEHGQHGGEAAADHGAEDAGEGAHSDSSDGEAGWQTAAASAAAARRARRKQARWERRQAQAAAAPPAPATPARAEDRPPPPEQRAGGEGEAAEDADAVGGSDGDGGACSSDDGEAPLGESSVACVTADFAMQNVLLQMGLRLVAPTGARVRELRRWGLRCSACFCVTKARARSPHSAGAAAGPMRQTPPFIPCAAQPAGVLGARRDCTVQRLCPST